MTSWVNAIMCGLGNANGMQEWIRVWNDTGQGD